MNHFCGPSSSRDTPNPVSVSQWICTDLNDHPWEAQNPRNSANPRKSLIPAQVQYLWWKVVVRSTIKLYSLSQCSGSVSEIPTFLLHDSDTMGFDITHTVVISCSIKTTKACLDQTRHFQTSYSNTKMVNKGLTSEPHTKPAFSEMSCIACWIWLGDPRMVNSFSPGLGPGALCSSTWAPDCWLIWRIVSPPETSKSHTFQKQFQ